MVKRLEMEGKIERIPIDQSTVREAIDIAERDLHAAEMNLEISNEWAYNISYNAALSAGRALIFSRGYRPKGGEGHVSVKEFLKFYLTPDEVAAFDRMRRKRHAATYDHSSVVTRTDAEGALATARFLVSKIKKILTDDGFVS
ncbi:HEPN domain protein [Methanoculleus chikugoensis]|uniref:HEPN domain protein n=1 Tax=Methanoculleus chikugoensis TaxID=118126 RepID=A0A1M4MMS1_9EURY|nr:HEPN domain-containing protein [Methanoculleus chikugoensis]SCL76173.1 HEPN domain protein [Methanoculleus chikugoensis]